MARGDGKTTRQMRAAPNGALFVWVNSALHYPRTLAIRLERTDLEIVSPFDLEHDRMRGKTWPAIVIDHAADLTFRQWDGLKRLKAQIRPASTGRKDG